MTLPQRVRVVGTGLLGTSLALALQARGVDVTLADTSPTAAALASDMGAGRVAHAQDEAPDLVVVAAPPDVVVDVVAAELTAWPDATVTDVTSVKNVVVEGVARRCGAERRRFVPGHPMAGRERSGAVAARSDLFEGRTWVICPDGADDARVADVTAVAQVCGAQVVTMSPAAHDEAVAAVSHVPQVAASLVAAQLRELPDDAVALSGQGVRDVTRIAASDPMLWTQILAGNAAAVRPLLEGVRASLDDVIHALSVITSGGDASGGTRGLADAAVIGSTSVAVTAPATPVTQDAVGTRDALATPATPGPRAVLAQTIAGGQEGRARIPGKHGAPAQAYASVAVVIPDEPGALGRVFTDVGETGISVEDMRLEHDDAVAAGLLELSVVPLRAQTLVSALSARGWAAHLVETA